jgi:hypothetical protein
MGRRELIGPRYGVRPASRSVPLISVSVCLERLCSRRVQQERRGQGKIARPMSDLNSACVSPVSAS